MGIGVHFALEGACEELVDAEKGGRRRHDSGAAGAGTSVEMVLDDLLPNEPANDDGRSKCDANTQAMLVSPARRGTGASEADEASVIQPGRGIAVDTYTDTRYALVVSKALIQSNDAIDSLLLS